MLSCVRTVMSGVTLQRESMDDYSNVDCAMTSRCEFAVLSELNRGRKLRAMSGRGSSVVSASTSARYEALVRVSAALSAYRERDTLFRSLAHELRPVLDFHFLGLALYDERTERVTPYVLEASGEIATPPDLSALPTSEQLTYGVLQHGEPLVIADVSRETRFKTEMAYLRAQGVESTCCLPLITPQRFVGMLLTGTRSPRVYDERDVTFLSLVANGVALAIDNTLHHAALQEALRVERERQQSLEASDALLRALSPVLDIREVFPRISKIAQRILPHDLLTLMFHDGAGGIELRARSEGHDYLADKLRLASVSRIDDAFILVDDVEAASGLISEPPDFWERVRAAGYRSAMITRARAESQRLALNFWSKRPRAFDESHFPAARRIADHVVVCVAHEQLARASREAAEAKLRAERLEVRVKSLSDELATHVGHGRSIGPSREWQAVLKSATQVARTDTTVLLAGESGTGKEVVARHIHRVSGRHAGPFVALNCAALPEQLLESELFGYERGAFTGAQQAKPGQIELASGGVLFLDEVGEMSASAQAKMLRVLQEREFQRLGSTRTIKANVRVIAATNRDLQKAMQRGDFREDLYFRLRVFDIRLPALRDRKADILPLAEVFLKDMSHMFARPPAGLTREAKNALLEYAWPGNVRELRNALERAAIVCEGALITAEHLRLQHDAHASAPVPATTDLNTVESELIRRVLDECEGNKSVAATRLGLSRTQLYVRLRRYQIE